jgi:hypothetical protein
MAEDAEKVETSAFWQGRLRKDGSTRANLERAIGINNLAQFTPHQHGNSSVFYMSRREAA